MILVVLGIIILITVCSVYYDTKHPKCIECGAEEKHLNTLFGKQCYIPFRHRSTCSKFHKSK